MDPQPGHQVSENSGKIHLLDRGEPSDSLQEAACSAISRCCGDAEVQVRAVWEETGKVD